MSLVLPQLAGGRREGVGGKKGSPTEGRTSVRGHTNSSIWTSGGVLNQVSKAGVGMGWGFTGVQ